MGIRAVIRTCAWLVVGTLSQVCAQSAAAEPLQVRVLDSSGRAVPDVAVFIEQQGAVATDKEPGFATMDQRNRRFVPHILVVQKGAAVEFPNSDVIAHHVYSFSKPNEFVLPLYKGTPPDPVRFEHPGIVTLGCNIHDSMIAYIVVVDTDLFGTTDDTGTAAIDVDGNASAWRVHAWSPRIRDSRDPLVIQIEPGEALSATFELQKKLRPAHGDETEAVFWDDY